ncbi:hypothetical protein NA56DRAFT_704272 [Hyaloscypha hepaticicola]|uniref:Uncharacterized protein n=1 Tax=Hyaloscypha hepaticicola TaxID=2082293 RepID=A0A2J6Q454_9HELO|nr:hypothetical protein NA56DRAFT_704272 [Hyaloscypha hepaticicola]
MTLRWINPPTPLPEALPGITNKSQHISGVNPGQRTDMSVGGHQSHTTINNPPVPRLRIEDPTIDSHPGSAPSPSPSPSP